MFFILNNVTCHKCGNENFYDDYFLVEVDEGFFNGKEVECNHGHKMFFISSSPRYQYLIQQGINSYVKGFYIESFHALYSSYEAYKKEFVGAFLFKETNDIKKTRKLLKQKYNRSERVSGAFDSAYISLSGGDLPKLIDEKSIRLRNDITHKGLIVTKENCIKIGNQIFESIALSNLMLNNRCLIDELELFNLIMDYNLKNMNFILKEKGFEIEFASSEERLNKPYITDHLILNILSIGTVLKESDITTNMFEQETDKRLHNI